jgi:serine/threonine protein phosphatase PrpC
MTVCPNCNAQNRTGARFCKSCGTSLPTPSLSTVPLDEEAIRLAKPPEPVQSPYATVKLEEAATKVRTNTRPLPPPQPLTPRPLGAVFGNYFVADRLVYSDERQNRYVVSQPGVPAEVSIHACPNPVCRAVFTPTTDGAIRFCTDCNTPLGDNAPTLILIETQAPLYPHIQDVIGLFMAQSSIRPPLAAFSEELAGSTRHCTILPEIMALTSRPEPSVVLKWGKDLALALNYLHANGLSFKGQINENSFGLEGDRPVWVNFAESIYAPDLSGQAQPDDVRALASLLFKWLTGKTQPGYDSNLSPAVNSFFTQATNLPGFTSGEELALAIDQVLAEAAVGQPVDYRLGRRTDVGRQRTLNEDSLLTLEMDRILQSQSRPLGVYLVADGMGGHAAGEIASGMIVNAISQKASTELFQTLSQSVPDQDRVQWLQGAVLAANQAVFEKRKAAGTDMGSTLVAAVLDGNKAFVTNVGDSRAYRINAQKIEQLSTDHSLVQRLIATNQITPQEARHHPQRNVIYRTVGDKPNVEVDVVTHTFAVGDRLLLCSDGMSGMVEDDQIHKIVMESSTPQAACDKLVEAANAAGGDDNITVVVVELVQP